MLELARELGLEDQVIASNDHLRKTFIWKNGRLIALPEGAAGAAFADLMGVDPLQRLVAGRPLCSSAMSPAHQPG